MVTDWGAHYEAHYDLLMVEAEGSQQNGPHSAGAGGLPAI